MKKHIPNIITLLNLYSGCIAVVFAVQADLPKAAFFAFLGIFFDFFDGFAARALGVQSELGVQLDSLADMVTSGVVPGVVLYQLFTMATGSLVPDMAVQGYSWLPLTGGSMLPLLGFLVILASAYRLANFNIDTQQKSSFIGLPTPANTLFIVSMPLILAFQGNAIINAIILNPWFLVVVTFLSCYMLNAKIPLFALKFKNFSVADNAIRYIFLILTLICITVLQYAAIPLVIVLYVLLSMISFKKTKKQP